jgi:hypothetical protein
VDLEEKFNEVLAAVGSLAANLREARVEIAALKEQVAAGGNNEPASYVSVSKAATLVDFEEGILRQHIVSGNLIARKPKGSREYRISVQDLRIWAEGEGASEKMKATAAVQRLLRTA